MLYAIINVSVKTFLYLMILLGLWIFSAPLILPVLKNSMKVSRFRQESKPGELHVESKSMIVRHISMLLSIVYNTKTQNAVTTFFVLSGSLFFIVFLILIRSSESFIFSLTFAILFGLLPYLVVRMRLRSIRVESSYEGEGLVTELTNQYKINHMNMIEAIHKTVPLIKKYPFTCKALFKLSLAIKEYSTPAELELIIDEFVYSIDTDWAIMLGQNIQIAVEEGIDIRDSLDDIISELKQIRDTIELDKRDNNEAFSMIKFMIPILYGLSFIAAVYFFGFTVSKFIQYQFVNDMGLRFAIITFSSMIFNIVILQFIKRPKYDL